MIRRLAILGATGDLTARYLLPALGALRAGGELGDDFQVVAVDRDDWADETFRNWAAAQLDRHMKELPRPAKHAVVASSRYYQADVTDPSSMAALVEGPEPLAVYLALAPSVFPGAVSALHRAGAAPHSVVVLEKPFHAVGLWLAATRKICQYDRAVRRGEWRWQTGHPIWRIRGRIFGLVFST